MKENTHSCMRGDTVLSDELAERFSSSSKMTLGLPRTRIDWPRTSRYVISPENKGERGEVGLESLMRLTISRSQIAETEPRFEPRDAQQVPDEGEPLGPGRERPAARTSLPRDDRAQVQQDEEAYCEGAGNIHERVQGDRHDARCCFGVQLSSSGGWTCVFYSRSGECPTVVEAL